MLSATLAFGGAGAVQAQGYGSGGGADWSGFYGGVSLAHGNGQVDWEDELGGYFTFVPGETYDFDMSRTGGGLQLGYNWQTPYNVVFGVELSGLLLNLEEDKDSPFFPVSDTLSASVRNPVALTGHLGYATGRWLPYVEAGVAMAEVGLDFDDSFTPASFDSQELHTGYVAGLGLGYKVSDRSALGINYRHYDFGKVTHDGTTSNVLVPESFETRANVGVVSVWWNYYLK